MRNRFIPAMVFVASVVVIAAVTLARDGVTPWGAILSIVMVAVIIAAFQVMNRGPWI